MVKARDVNLPNSFPVKGHTFALARSSYLAQLAIVVALAGCSCGEVGSTRLNPRLVKTPHPPREQPPPIVRSESRGAQQLCYDFSARPIAADS